MLEDFGVFMIGLDVVLEWVWSCLAGESVGFLGVSLDVL